MQVPSVPLGRQSANLGKKSASQGLAKSSIISLAKNSKIPDDAEAADEEEIPWHAIPDAAEVVAELASSREDGLSSSEWSSGHLHAA